MQSVLLAVDSWGRRTGQQPSSYFRITKEQLIPRATTAQRTKPVLSSGNDRVTQIRKSWWKLGTNLYPHSIPQCPESEMQSC